MLSMCALVCNLIHEFDGSNKRKKQVVFLNFLEIASLTKNIHTLAIVVGTYACTVPRLSCKLRVL